MGFTAARVATISQVKQTLQSPLEFVKQSPMLVFDHDKEGWLALFSEKGVVEDPVGMKPVSRKSNQEKDPIADFYDIFIAPNRVTFDEVADYICGNMVMRSVEVVAATGTGPAVRVPAHIMYELEKSLDQSGWKIFRMAAHWEIRPLIKDQLRHWHGWVKMAKVTYLLARVWGLGGIRGYMRAMTKGIFESGKVVVEDFANSCGGLKPSVPGSLAALSVVEFPAGEGAMPLESVLEQFDGPLTIGKMFSSGFITTFEFSGTSSGDDVLGIGLFRFNEKTKVLEQAQLFV